MVKNHLCLQYMYCPCDGGGVLGDSKRLGDKGRGRQQRNERMRWQNFMVNPKPLGNNCGYVSLSGV